MRSMMGGVHRIRVYRATGNCTEDTRYFSHIASVSRFAMLLEHNEINTSLSFAQITPASTLKTF